MRALFLSMNHCRPAPTSVPPPPYSCTCVAEEHLSHIVHGRIAAGDDDFSRIPELAREAASSATARASCAFCIDPEVSIKKPRPWTRLIERRHDELAVARLPAMRTPERAVVATERAVAERDAHGLANDRHVVDLRRQHAVGPAPQPQGDIIGEGRHVHDALRDLAPNELRLDRIDPRSPPVLSASSGSSQGRRSPWAPEPQSQSCGSRETVCAVLSSVARAGRLEQLVVIHLRARARLQSVLGGLRWIAWQRQSLRERDRH